MKTKFYNPQRVSLTIEEMEKIYYILVGKYPKSPEDFDMEIKFDLAEGISTTTTVAGMISLIRTDTFKKYLSSDEEMVRILLMLDIFPYASGRVKLNTIFRVLYRFRDKDDGNITAKTFLFVLLTGKSHNLTSRELRRIAKASEDEVDRVEKYLRYFHEKKVEERIHKNARCLENPA